MKKLAAQRGEAVAPATANDTAVLCTEFLLNHSRAFLRLWTASAVAAVLLTGGMDWLAVFHLMQLKFTDAMGRPIGSTAGLVAMSGVTLIGYVLLGAAWARPERAAKAVALALYAVVLVLLGLAIAPVESSAIREVWTGLTGGGGFGGMARRTRRSGSSCLASVCWPSPSRCSDWCFCWQKTGWAACWRCGARAPTRWRYCSGPRSRSARWKSAESAPH